jgi:hypothetical protein
MPNYLISESEEQLSEIKIPVDNLDKTFRDFNQAAKKVTDCEKRNNTPAYNLLNVAIVIHIVAVVWLEFKSQ